MPPSPQELIAAYYKQKPDFIALWQKNQPLESQESTDTNAQTTTDMPVHPKEEETGGSESFTTKDALVA